MADNIFPLFPRTATQTETVTAVDSTIVCEARQVTIDVASGVAGVGTLGSHPVGLVSTLKAGTIAGGATIVITSESGEQTETLDATGEAVTIMFLEDGDFTVVDGLPADTSS